MKLIRTALTATVLLASGAALPCNWTFPEDLIDVRRGSLGFQPFTEEAQPGGTWWVAAHIDSSTLVPSSENTGSFDTLETVATVGDYKAIRAPETAAPGDTWAPVSGGSPYLEVVEGLPPMAPDNPPLIQLSVESVEVFERVEPICEPNAFPHAYGAVNFRFSSPATATTLHDYAAQVWTHPTQTDFPTDDAIQTYDAISLDRWVDTPRRTEIPGSRAVRLQVVHIPTGFLFPAVTYHLGTVPDPDNEFTDGGGCHQSGPVSAASLGFLALPFLWRRGRRPIENSC